MKAWEFFEKIGQKEKIAKDSDMHFNGKGRGGERERGKKEAGREGERGEGKNENMNGCGS